ncbi:oxygen-independent coproporphyrinogen-3 oxidase [Evansella vedderi]|uniref:Oxygen-independent coproporphyrinogen-3 oxidase n=1 Tax=Evansella vedderi TaxID=38282 RepID=A0ABT9ZSK1_9BACI|nr:coproporphyrinogen III oxidase [Evansella vedderi]MDQ0254203.1 oxygen-independent coproporphyrinogen-3 oxidase [Evansella vedderi]
MKVIELLGVQESFQRSCERIVQLFFEESTVRFPSKPAKEEGLAISFHTNDLEDTNQMRITGELFENKTKVNAQDVIFNINEQPRKKVEKQGVSFVLLKLLEEYTGMEQPWGVLTGIRPTKLYHMMRREGKSKEEIAEILQEKYLLQPEKIQLLQQIVERQLTVVPDLDRIGEEVSIYIGIPFCPTMCAYCTFPAYPINGRNGSVEEFLMGLHYEMEKTGQWLKDNNIRITTIYYGGGTPTSITAEQMDALYAKMYKVFPAVENVRELTVEAGRPDTIEPAKIDVLNKWNVDRISVNPQSFTDDTLKAIGRRHSVEETITKYHLAFKMGLTNINMDLIIGLPGEGKEEFSHTLEVTKELQPASLTVHTLSYKRASQMTRYKEKYKVAGRDEIHEMMEMASHWMKKEGYVPYYLYRQKNILGNLENVGYAKPEQESLYNIMIMEEAQTIIGLGCGASSKWVDPITGKIDRYANPKDPQTYISKYEEYTHKKIEQLTELFSRKRTEV